MDIRRQGRSRVVFNDRRDRLELFIQMACSASGFTPMEFSPQVDARWQCALRVRGFGHPGCGPIEIRNGLKAFIRGKSGITESRLE